MRYAVLILLSVVLATGSACKKSSSTPSGDYARSGIVLSGSQAVPASSSAATATIDVAYTKSSNTFSYTLKWNNLSAPPTGAHIHGPATAGLTANILFSLPGFSAVSGSQSGSFVLDETITKSAELLGGKWYVDIHSANYSGGELRAQITF